MRAAPFLPFAALVSLVLPWRHLDVPPGAFVAEQSQNAFQIAPILAFLIVLSAVAAVWVAIRFPAAASPRAHGLLRAYAALATMIIVYVVWIALIRPPEWPAFADVGFGVGAYLGGLTALAMLALAYSAMRRGEGARVPRMRRR
jgi:hypothetical protein